MKRLSLLAVTALIISCFSVYADEERDKFISDLLEMAKTKQVPVTMEQASVVFDSATSSLYNSLFFIIDATGNKEKSRQMRSSLEQLNGTDKNDKKAQKKAAKEKQILLEEATADAKSALTAGEGERKDLAQESVGDMMKALTYLSNGIINDVLVAAGTPTIINDLKAKGKSPAIVKEVNAAISLGKSAPAQLVALKDITASLITFMKTRGLKVPNASEAMAGAEKE